MKKLLGVFTALVIGYALTLSGAEAREGSIELSNSDVSCEGVSIWRESAYKISGRCQGLVYPFETRLDHYVLWAKLDNGNVVRIDDVDRGYFEGSVSDSFVNLSITAEDSSSPRRPGTTEVLNGSIQTFAFDKSEPTPAPAAVVAPDKTVSTVPDTAPAGSTVGSVFGRIMRALLIIVAVIIVITIIASLLFRRRGSVSV